LVDLTDRVSQDGKQLPVLRQSSIDVCNCIDSSI